MINITIGITCYNEGKLLLNAWESVLQQTCKDWECIIINDASPDREINEICESLSHRNLRVIRLSKNGGLSKAINEGVSAAKSTIFYPLNADDLLKPDAVETVLETFRKHHGCGFVYGNTELFGDDFIPQIVNSPESISVKDLLLSQPIIGANPFSTMTWRLVGGYDAFLSWGNQDWDFWLSALEKGQTAVHVNKVLYRWRQRQGSLGRSYEDRWPKICEYMYNKHKETYDKYQKGHEFIAWGWKRAAFYHYQKREFKKALECAEEALKLLPHDDQMKKLRLRCKIPPVLLDTARAAKRIFKYFTGDSNS